MPRPPALTLLLGYSRGKERGRAVPTLPSFPEALAPQIARCPSWPGSEEGAVPVPCGDVPTARGPSAACSRAGGSCTAADGDGAVVPSGHMRSANEAVAQPPSVLLPRSLLSWSPGATRPVGGTASPALWDRDDTPQLQEESVSEARRCTAADLPEAMGDSRSVPQTLGCLWRVPEPCCSQGDARTGRHTQQGAAGGTLGPEAPAHRGELTAQHRHGSGGDGPWRQEEVTDVG